MSDYLSIAGSTYVTVPGTLVTSNGVKDIDTSVTIQYAIRGKAYNTTAITDGTVSVDINTGAAFVPLVGGNSVANTPGQGCALLHLLNASGTYAVAQGKPQALDMAGKFIIAPQFPAVPEGYCPFGYTILKAGATAAVSITPFTDNWDAAGVTTATVDIHRLPDRPQVA